MKLDVLVRLVYPEEYGMFTLKDSLEGKAKDVKMPPDPPASAPTHPRPRIVWLVLGHIAVGLMGAYVAYLAGRDPTLCGGASSASCSVRQVC